MKLSENKFFWFGLYASSNNLHLYSVTYGSTSSNWSAKMIWPSSSCSLFSGESLLSSDNSKIYSFISFGGASASHMYFLSIHAVDGTICLKELSISLFPSTRSGNILISRNISSFLNGVRFLILKFFVNSNFIITNLVFIIFKLYQ